MQKLLKSFIFIFYILGLNLFFMSCAIRSKPAPIENVTTPSKKATTASTVQGGAIGQQSNNPNMQTKTADGTVLGSITPNQAISQNNGQSNTINKEVDVTSNNTNNDGWIMPTKGNVVRGFNPKLKGVDFTGNAGQPIYAVATGKVLYSGNGLVGYGNLIIIKHDENYLTAYSHNKDNLVREGVTVTKGQKIATMGFGKNNEPLLHFEVRKKGKPIDPFSMIK